MDGWANLTLKTFQNFTTEVTVDDVEIGTWLMAQVGAKHRA